MQMHFYTENLSQLGRQGPYYIQHIRLLLSLQEVSYKRKNLITFTRGCHHLGLLLLLFPPPKSLTVVKDVVGSSECEGDAIVRGYNQGEKYILTTRTLSYLPDSMSLVIFLLFD